MYEEIFKLQARMYKAMANAKRLEIIQLLRDKELSVTQMLEMLGLPQANLSQHLQVLRDQGLVKDRRNGKQIYYKLANKNIMKASDLMREILVNQHQGESEVVEELRLKMKDLVPVAIDPVCGMRLSPKTAAFGIKLDQNYYYFCAQGCKEKFERSPRKYIEQGA
jgi:DNA-binding transcriptional ArsR family regulator/YHS domain-containing protein